MISGYTLTTFPNVIHAATAATKATTNKQQHAVHVQTRNRDCTLIGGEDLDNRFLSSHKKKN